MRSKTRRRQRGGSTSSRLYPTVGDLTRDEILRVFCKDRPFEDFPSSERPFFILKWGPPGSGKSSEKVRSFIERLGVKSRDYIDYSPDTIVENLLPYRFESAMAKAENLRMKTLYELKRYKDVKEILTRYKVNNQKRYTNKTKKNVQEFLSEWPSGKSVPVSRLEEFGALLNSVLYDKSSSIYSFYRTKNTTGSSKTIREKMRDILAEAFRTKKHIQYESGGAGYGEGLDRQKVSDQFTLHRMLRSKTHAPLIDIFRNTQEELLGKIRYDAQNLPIGLVESSLGPFSVPLSYRIVVVYPIIPREEIVKRAQARAARMFFQRDEVTVPNLDMYRGMLLEFAKELYETLGGEGEIGRIVDEALRLEQERFGKTPESYLGYLKEMITKVEGLKDGETLSLPFFRGIGATAIMDSIEQAFQYSVDYFLKQYILIGRLEQVIYINTASPKEEGASEILTDPGSVPLSRRGSTINKNKAYDPSALLRSPGRS